MSDGCTPATSQWVTAKPRDCGTETIPTESSGFADRLAAMLDALHPGLQYANLAIRGRRIRDVLDDQLPQALRCGPIWSPSASGMNDITRPGLLFDRALADLDLLNQRLAESGATVVTTTFPDIGRIVPIGRVLASRVLRTNEAIVTAADRHGFRLVDLCERTVDDPAGHVERRPRPRVDERAHSVRCRGSRGSQSAWQ